MLICLPQISIDVLNDCIMAWTQEAHTVEGVGRLTGLNWGFFIFWRDLQISRDCACSLHPIPQFEQDLLLYISCRSNSHCLELGSISFFLKSVLVIIADNLRNGSKWPFIIWFWMFCKAFPIRILKKVMTGLKNNINILIHNNFHKYLALQRSVNYMTQWKTESMYLEFRSWFHRSDL